MSQQATATGRAYAREKGDPALQTYTGQVMKVMDPQLGKNGKERPRGVKISDRPGDYEGRTFRWWYWKDDQTALLQEGNWVTVYYEEEPGNNGYRGSNAISIVEQTTAPGGGQANGSTDVWGSASSGPEATTPQPTNYGVTPAPLNDYDRREQEKQARIEARQAFLDQRDDERTLQIEAAWAIECVLSRETDGKLTEDQIIDKALQLVILKRSVARELIGG